MAFDRENLSIIVNNQKAGVVPSEFEYYNEDDDDVTTSGYFDDFRVRVGDQVTVLSANYKTKLQYYVSSVTSGAATVANSVLAIVADATALTLADVITFNTTTEAISMTLPDGVEGQVIRLVCVVDGGNDAVITPTHLAAGSTLTFADANDSCTMLFINGTWQITSLEGVAVA